MLHSNTYSKRRNMKRSIQYLLIIALLGFAVACDTDDFLTEVNPFERDLEGFYSTPTEIDEAFGGVYHALYTDDPVSHEIIIANLLSDMMLAGGGTDDAVAKEIDAFRETREDVFRDLLRKTYDGVNRSNGIIENIERFDFTQFFDNEQDAIDFVNQAIGEAYFMRGFFYLRAAKFFGGLPLILETGQDRFTTGRSTIPETYAQIASDFKKAIETMPAVPISQIPGNRYGHANKWVAEAFMARAYLYYTGYMTNMEGQATSELPLTDGGSVTATDIEGYLNDLIANSGHALATDFRNLWPYAHVNQSAGNATLPWADNEGLAWVGQDGLFPTIGTGNAETIFSVRHSSADWNFGGQKINNRVALFFSIRGNSLVPFGQGWGWGPVNPKLWNQWDDADPRKQGSIIEIGNPDQGTQNYDQSGEGDHNTGFFNKKYTSVQHDGARGVIAMFAYLYNNPNTDMQLWHSQDMILMRMADVLLMHSEITQTATGINTVRARAGLPAVGYSVDALKQERLHELAFEGLRWFDLVRWGDVNTAFTDVINVRNLGVDGVYNATYRPEIKGLMPFPQTDIRLSNGVLTQNPGWN